MKIDIEPRLAALVRGRITLEDHQRACDAAFEAGIYWGLVLAIALGCIIRWLIS